MAKKQQDALLKTILRDDVQALSAYLVPDSGGLIKLDAMENPYGLPEGAQNVLANAIKGVPLNRYPDPNYRMLKQVLRETQAIDLAIPLDNILLGNGSDELISMLCVACARDNAVVLAPSPSFVMYEMSAKLAGMQFVGVPLKLDFSLDISAMLALIVAYRPALLFLAYPNNPTGNLFARSDIEILLEAMDGIGVVVIDEAYYHFAQQTWFSRLSEFPHLIVMRTVSKLGLAGIRLGFMAGALMSEFNKVRPPYNVNRLTEAAALALLPLAGVWQEQIDAILSERAEVLRELQGWSDYGLEVFDSAANFLLLRLPVLTDVEADPADFFCQICRTQGVLIKNLSKMPSLQRCIRVTIGSRAENQVFVELLSRHLLSSRLGRPV